MSGFTLEAVCEVLKKNDFYLHASMPKQQEYFFTDGSGIFVDVDLAAQTFTVGCNIAACMVLRYNTLSLRFLVEDSEAWDLALRRVDYINSSRAVKSMKRGFIESMIG